jgi:putative transposase
MTKPTRAWLTQQARNVNLTGLLDQTRFLIRDRDNKFSGSFDEVFRSEGITVIQTPIRAPKANAYTERFVRTARTECLDWLLIIDRRHLEHTLRVFLEHCHAQRPHGGRQLRNAPLVRAALAREDHIERTDLLADLIHQYGSVAGESILGTLHAAKTATSVRSRHRARDELASSQLDSLCEPPKEPLRIDL